MHAQEAKAVSTGCRSEVARVNLLVCKTGFKPLLLLQETRLHQQAEEVKQQLQEAQESAAAAELVHASAVARHLKRLEEKEVCHPHCAL